MQVNFLVEHMGASQLAFFLASATNTLTQEYPITVFYGQLHRPCKNIHAPSLLMSEAWGQRGITIATSMATAAALLKMPGPQHRYYYVWDMEWLGRPGKTTAYPVGHFTGVLRHPSLKLIMRCDSHAAIMTNNYNVKVEHVFDNFDVDKLKELIDGTVA